MNTIIIEKDIVFRQQLESFITKHPSLTLQGSFESILQAYHIFFSHNIELIFLNIENISASPNVDFSMGIQKNPLIIFVQSNENNSINTENCIIVNLISNNVDIQVFNKSIEKAQKLSEVANVNKESKETYITTKTGRMRVVHKDILYIKAIQNYVKFFTKTDTYTQHITLKDMYSQLPKELFVQIQKSYIVNIHAIQQIGRNFVKVNNVDLPIGLTFKDSFFKQIRKTATFITKNTEGE